MHRRHQGRSPYDEDDKNSYEISKAKLRTVKEEPEESKPTRSSVTMVKQEKEQHTRKKKAYVRGPTSTRRHESGQSLGGILRYSLVGLFLGFVLIAVMRAKQRASNPMETQVQKQDVPPPIKRAPTLPLSKQDVKQQVEEVKPKKVEDIKQTKSEVETEIKKVVPPPIAQVYPFSSFVEEAMARLKDIITWQDRRKERKEKTRQQCKSEMNGICKQINELYKTIDVCGTKERKICGEITALKQMSHLTDSSEKITSLRGEYLNAWTVHKAAVDEYYNLLGRLENECEDTSCAQKLYPGTYCHNL
jgi:hypothetical protein